MKCWLSVVTVSLWLKTTRGHKWVEYLHVFLLVRTLNRSIRLVTIMRCLNKCLPTNQLSTFLEVFSLTWVTGDWWSSASQRTTVNCVTNIFCFLGFWLQEGMTEWKMNNPYFTSLQCASPKGLLRTPLQFLINAII